MRKGDGLAAVLLLPPDDPPRKPLKNLPVMDDIRITIENLFNFK